MEHWHLSEQDFFDQLEEEKKHFLSYAVRRAIKKNTVIFAEGDVGHSAYYLERGSVKICRATLSGKEPIFWVRKAGDLFGLAEVFARQDRICTAQALTACSLYEITGSNFEIVLKSHYAVSQKVASVLGRRIRFLCEQVENLMVHDISERLARLLVYLSFHHPANSDTSTVPVSIPLSLTQEDMAAMTGSCQQTISETLKKLQKEGLISVSRKEIIILNPSKMMEHIYK